MINQGMKNKKRNETGMNKQHDEVNDWKRRMKERKRREGRSLTSCIPCRLGAAMKITKGEYSAVRSTLSA